MVTVIIIIILSNTVNQTTYNILTYYIYIYRQTSYRSPYSMNET